MMKNYLPKVVIERKKQGFSSPDASWFKGESIDFVRQKLICNNSRIFEYLDRTIIKSLVNEHLQGEKNRRLLIWSLIYFDQFLNSF